MRPSSDNPWGYRFFEDGGFPDSYEGCLFKTDFRVWLRYGHLMGRGDIEQPQLLAEMAIRLCYQGIPKGTTAEALLEGIAWFADCGEDDRLRLLKLPERLLEDAASMAAKRREGPKAFDAFWDFKELWASFKAQYGIDLYTVEGLHWWGYVALLGGLIGESPVARLCQLRKLDPKSKPTKERVISSKLAALPEMNQI
jgi:hypothetical protein